MACKVAACVPLAPRRGGAGLARLGLLDAAPLTAEALCGALLEAVAALRAEVEAEAQEPDSPDAWACSALDEDFESPREVVQYCLGAVLARLDQVLSALPPRSPARSPSSAEAEAIVLAAEDRQEGRALLTALLARDAPAQLLACLDLLGFEARKDAMRLFSLLLRSALPLGADAALVEYLRSHRRISEYLLEGSGRPEVFMHCAQMLRACTRYPQLVAGLLEDGAASRLIDLASHQSFDISSEAFSSLRELLLAQRSVSAAYVSDHFAEFFGRFHTLLRPDMDYVARRQALRLLGDILLDRAFMTSMLTYVASEQFLQIHMNMLRDSSKTIQVDAFHVFKIFVANPQKPARVVSILVKNKDRLLKLLSCFSGRSECLEADLSTVMRVLQALEAPPSAPRRPAGAAAAAALRAEA